MTRDISTANVAASESAVIAPVWFVKLRFDSGDVCLHTGLGVLGFGGDDYIGSGDIGAIGQIEEDSELARSPVTLTLRGLPTDVVGIILGEYYQGRPATIFQGYLDTESMQLVDTPVVIYRGRMDTASTDQGETLGVTLAIESRFAAWERPVVRRYNDADQQSRFPGDRGLEFVERSTEKQIFWGQKAP